MSMLVALQPLANTEYSLRQLRLPKTEDREGFGAST